MGQHWPSAKTHIHTRTVWVAWDAHWYSAHSCGHRQGQARVQTHTLIQIHTNTHTHKHIHTYARTHTTARHMLSCRITNSKCHIRLRNTKAVLICIHTIECTAAHTHTHKDTHIPSLPEEHLPPIDLFLFKLAFLSIKQSRKQKVQHTEIVPPEKVPITPGNSWINYVRFYLFCSVVQLVSIIQRNAPKGVNVIQLLDSWILIWLQCYLLKQLQPESPQLSTRGH